ncbi:MAG: right-handed parallel beta-helix repeat-containing protein, partial [Thermodesulfobacteriota bacterium]
IVQPKIAGVTIQDGVKNWLVQGFDITGGAIDGIKVYSGPGEISNNWIHGNKSQGILIPDASDITIEGNTIEYNGLNPVQCNSGVNTNPRKHCHGIYMSNYRGLGGPDRVVIRGNTIRGNAGRGVQWNGDNTGTQQKMTGSVIENNVIEKCSWGMVLWANADNNMIRNNTISTPGYPPTEDTDHPCIGIYSSNGNTISGNKCTSSFQGSLGGGIGQNYFGTSINVFIGNTFIKQ